MNSLKDAKNELINTLVTNAGLVSFFDGIKAGSVITVIEGQKKVSKINGSEYPVLIIEMGDGEFDDYLLGDTQQDLNGDLFEFSFGWYNKDTSVLLNQRLDLLRLVKDAISGNRKLNNGINDTVENCWLTSYQNDQSVFYPDHFMNFVLSVETKMD